MNSIQLPSSQTNALLFVCLAILNSDFSNEEKIRNLEEALTANILLSDQPLKIIETDIPMLDEAMILYSARFAEKLRSGELVKISTGYKSLDEAFFKKIEAALSSISPKD